MVVSFAIGDRRYDVGPIALQATFAPYARGNEAYLPLRRSACARSILRSAKTAACRCCSRSSHRSTSAVKTTASRWRLRAGAPIRPRVVQENPTPVTYAFDGVGTALDGTRQVSAGGVRSMQITNHRIGSRSNDARYVALDPGTVVDAPRRTATVATSCSLHGRGRAAGKRNRSRKPVGAKHRRRPSPRPPKPGHRATVTGVSQQPSSDGVAVAIAVTGRRRLRVASPARSRQSLLGGYRRMRSCKGRRSTNPSRLRPPAADRVRFFRCASVKSTRTTVRVALIARRTKIRCDHALGDGHCIVDVGFARRRRRAARRKRQRRHRRLCRAANGRGRHAGAARRLGSGDSNSPGDTTWKFGPRSGYVADQSAPHRDRSRARRQRHRHRARRSREAASHARHGQTVARHSRRARLASEHDARDRRGRLSSPTTARMTNFKPATTSPTMPARACSSASTSTRSSTPGPYGTTTYISKPDDVAFAQTRGNAASHPTERKTTASSRATLYVTLHARMPAVLIETAFLTNPADYALLIVGRLAAKSRPRDRRRHRRSTPASIRFPTSRRNK